MLYREKKRVNSCLGTTGKLYSPSATKSSYMSIYFMASKLFLLKDPVIKGRREIPNLAKRRRFQKLILNLVGCSANWLYKFPKREYTYNKMLKSWGVYAKCN